MPMYNDLFFRTNLSDIGNVPSPPPAYSSPDIIPHGTSPVPDPAGFFAGNYGSDVGQALVNRASNYIYLRMKNLFTGTQSGLASLYYSRASLILYPSQWRNNALMTSDNASQVPVSAQSTNGVAVTTDPFAWTPPSLDDNDHYCLISRVVTEQHPNPIPSTGSVSDFSEFILSNPGFGWRNVSLTDAGAPTFTTSVAYQQGSDRAPILFLLLCENVPAGAAVAFSAGTPGPVPLIDLEKTVVPQNNGSFAAGMHADVPGSYSTNITYSYWANGTSPPPGFKITLVAQYYVDSKIHLYDRLLTPHELGVPHSLRSQIGPQRGLTIGSHTTIGV